MAHYKLSGSISMEKVLPALRGRLGWSGDATAPASGRYFDDGSFHALITRDNIRSVQPNPKITDAELDTLLLKYKDTAITRALSLLFCEPDVIEQAMVFTPLRFPKQILPHQSELFAGFEITIAASTDYVIHIRGAQLEFTHAATFKLYLFREGDATPMWEQEVTTVAGRTTLVPLTDCFLSYGMDRDVTYYFGYKSDELGVSARPLGVPVEFGVYTMALFSTVWSDEVPMSYARNSYPSRSVGLNLDVAILRDRTHLVESNPHIFDQLVGLCMTSKVVEEILFSKRINTEAGAIKDTAQAMGAQLDLTGTIPATDAPQIHGIRAQIAKEARRIRDIFQNKQKGVVSIYDPC